MVSANGVLDLVKKRPRPLWMDIPFEIGILLAVYLIYAYTRGSVDAKATVAFQHSLDIMDLEKTLGLFHEHSIQSFFLESSFRTDVANTLYTIAYYPALVLFAIWAYWRHRPKYKTFRTAFVISAILAIIIFAAFPAAPPRFFDGSHVEDGAKDLGFVDTLVTHWHAKDSSVQQFYNPYAAMPSCHFGWALMIGIGIWWMTKSRWARVIGVLLPIAMLVGITSTGNHFILDAVGGAIVVGISFGLTFLILKYWPQPRGENGTS